MSTSYGLMDLVRGAISTPYVSASDSDVARALQVSRASISAYKAGKQVMSLPTFARACQLAKLPDDDVVELLGRLLIESAGDEQNWRFWLRISHAVRRHLWDGSKVAALVLAVGTGSGIVAPVPAQAAQTPVPVCIFYVQSAVGRAAAGAGAGGASRA